MFIKKYRYDFIYLSFSCKTFFCCHLVVYGLYFMIFLLQFIINANIWCAYFGKTEFFVVFMPKVLSNLFHMTSV